MGIYDPGYRRLENEIIGKMANKQKAKDKPKSVKVNKDVKSRRPKTQVARY